MESKVGDEVVANALEFSTRGNGAGQVIRYLIDFALRNRILVLSVAIVLFVWGIISFRNLPIEAYPDVADTYAQIITQWPGHAAEEIEQQITVPLEVTLNGVAHMTHLRSTSLAGLSVITIVYDDETTTFNARQEVLDRLQQVTLPTGVSPSLGPDYSPTGQIMFYTLHSMNPKYDAMELKTLNDWYVVNQLKSVPNIVDVNPFGGPTREYQVQIEPGETGFAWTITQSGRTGGGLEQHQCRRRLYRARRAGAQRTRRWLDANHGRHCGHGSEGAKRHSGPRARSGQCGAGSQSSPGPVGKGDSVRRRRRHQ